jgi:Raf kinase inhibitor-like YbhB/YbcL family protein
MSTFAIKPASRNACCTIILHFSFFLCVQAQTTSALTMKGVGFAENGLYPKEYTCDSTGISPALQWEGVPKGTASFVLTMHHFDPTGNRHVYWVLYNIPAHIQNLPSDASGIGSIGVNTVNRGNAYAPPCSKGPGPKKYVITLYAVTKTIALSQPPRDITMDVVMKEIEQNKLDSALLSVTYSRSPKILIQLP